MTIDDKIRDEKLKYDTHTEDETDNMYILQLKKHYLHVQVYN